jgi:hypothetical protein
LLEILSAGALTTGDKWYEPSLVKTLVAAAKKKGETGKEPANKKPKQDNHENISDIDREELDTKRNTKHKPKPKAKTASKTGNKKRPRRRPRATAMCLWIRAVRQAAGSGAEGAPCSRRTALVAGF